MSSVTVKSKRTGCLRLCKPGTHWSARTLARYAQLTLLHEWPFKNAAAHGAPVAWEFPFSQVFRQFRWVSRSARGEHRGHIKVTCYHQFGPRLIVVESGHSVHHQAHGRALQANVLKRGAAVK